MRAGILAEDEKHFADREKKVIEAALEKSRGRVQAPPGQPYCWEFRIRRSNRRLQSSESTSVSFERVRYENELLKRESAYRYDPNLGKIRELEQRNALKRLGVPAENISRLRLPDGDIAAHETRLVEQLLPFVTKDTHLIAPGAATFIQTMKPVAVQSGAHFRPERS